MYRYLGNGRGYAENLTLYLLVVALANPSLLRQYWRSAIVDWRTITVLVDKTGQRALVERTGSHVIICSKPGSIPASLRAI